MPNIFAPPVAAYRSHPAVWSHSQGSHKRKKQRLDKKAGRNEDQDGGGFRDPEVQSSSNLEYTAVVTPQERHQRRVAGQPLDQEPPQFPFPHAADPATKVGAGRRSSLEGGKRPEITHLPETPQSLHMQHLAALTTILHLSLLKEDFPRASRALGLLFREDLVSENAAMRNRGFMGIAAEVLLRNGTSRDHSLDSAAASHPFTREGFEKAKRLYERLIVRHPYHKSWPHVVNAIDFYLAMFNLWIYVVHNEHATPSKSPEDIENDVGPSRKVRELDQANQIANRMDTCMATVPYMDEPELIRLRAMVALWTADLHEDCAYIVKNNDPQASDDFAEQHGLPLLPEEEQASRENEHLSEAGLARDRARELLSRLGGHATSEDE
ncbi:hypothetical protein G647_09704 [Cladophialophora carrionii CBS 160.54]|uniref:Transcription factor domain-containing protein n=1 Tax=Cladophialophora carrionii CBS 160.54 TaxID=1279043 RepID=V9DMG9_9EURO|nr:uncharacterized protein G647_09704 [Cladophialophora carrionii CBS 160.54]ETI27513.1 hypothetical protein G647_09704 [Cladophialophora carrionii CBS 160.54]